MATVAEPRAGVFAPRPRLLRRIDDASSWEVQNQVRATDWQTFIVAMTVLLGGGWMLASLTVTGDVKLAVAGFIGAVIQFFFANKIAERTTAATLAATQTGAAQSAQANGGARP